MSAPPEFLEALCDELRRAVAQGDVESAAALLARRRPALEHAVAAAVTPEERERLAVVLEAFLTSDAETERVLREALEALAADIAAMEVGRRGLAGYAKTGRTAAYCIDERG